MSLCQNKSSSCGACCGIFNLDLDKNSIHQILKRRTLDFKKNVNFKNKNSIIQFREKNEELESEIPKKDFYTYNCPFLGFIEDEIKIGCMIHPVFSGDEKSQNFSFYGASICSAYDCRNKEERNWLEKILSKMNFGFYEYSSIASNHIFITKIQIFFLLNEIEINPENKKQIQLFEILFYEYILSNKNHFTSFEIEMENKEKSEVIEDILNFYKLDSKKKVLNSIEEFLNK